MRITAERLRGLLRERDMSQRELARLACLSASQVTRYMQPPPEGRRPGLLPMERIAKALGVQDPASIFPHYEIEKAKAEVEKAMRANLLTLEVLELMIQRAKDHIEAERRRGTLR